METLKISNSTGLPRGNKVNFETQQNLNSCLSLQVAAGYDTLLLYPSIPALLGSDPKENSNGWLAEQKQHFAELSCTVKLETGQTQLWKTGTITPRAHSYIPLIPQVKTWSREEKHQSSLLWIWNRIRGNPALTNTDPSSVWSYFCLLVGSTQVSADRLSFQRNLQRQEEHMDQKRAAVADNIPQWTLNWHRFSKK